MTSQQRNDLISFFCDNSVHEIVAKRNELLQIMEVNHAEELSAIGGYDKLFRTLQKVALKINSISLKMIPENQVKGCVSYLYELNKAEDHIGSEVAQKIIDARLLSNWNEQLRKSYKAGVELIFDWAYVFISYTNSSKPSVNYQYRELIGSEFESDYITENREKINIIAALIHKLFDVQRLKFSFYDKTDLTWGDKWKEQIFQFSQKTFAFLQFVEPEIFREEEEKNYCYMEYRSYCEAMNSFTKTYNIPPFDPLCFYMISNPDNDEKYNFEPAMLPPHFEKWVSDIRKKQFVQLHSNMSKPELMVKIQEASTKIVKLRQNIVENYLNSIK